MSITDELREFMAGADGYELWCPRHKNELTVIADRIDAEHEAACAEAYGNGVMSVPIALDESAWVELPKDADGVPIHVGDVMEFSEFEIEHPVTRTVEGIGQGTFFAWCGERGYQQHDAKRYRHHTPPTVEDVLAEFADKVCNSGHQWGLDAADTIAEYAAKLRLAGEDE